MPERSSGAPSPLYPAFLKLAGRHVLVVGGGAVAAAKLPALLEADACVTLVAPDVCDAIAASAVAIRRRAFSPSDLNGMCLAIAAAPPEVNAQVAAVARERGIFVNAVDDPQHATMYAGGIVRRAGVTVAISTDGDAPALAGLLREAIDAMLPADLEAWMRRARDLRTEWQAAGTPMTERRPQLLEALIALYARREAADQ